MTAEQDVDKPLVIHREYVQRAGTRGVDHQQSQMFSYLSPETRVRKDHPLRKSGPWWTKYSPGCRGDSQGFEKLRAQHEAASSIERRERRYELSRTNNFFSSLVLEEGQNFSGTLLGVVF